MSAKNRSFLIRLALPIAVLTLILASGLVVAAEPQPQGLMTTAFTYQGRLTDDGGDPIDDICNFQFTLWNDPGAGSQVGPMLNPTGVPVVDGLFTVPLDFGGVFDGTALWLKVAVKCTGDAAYVALSPRQALTAAPYAVYAPRADMVDGHHAADFAPTGHDHWGQSWTGTGTGLTLSGGEAGLSGSGALYGVYGQTETTGGSAVYGVSSATTGPAFGVQGQSQSTSGIGVYGAVSSPTGITYGVHGLSSSSAGIGVFGWANAASGTTYGVYGRSDAVGGSGLFGRATATTGTNYGVYGLADAYTDYAVGTYGRSESTSGRGVIGYVPRTTGDTMGVHGKSASNAGFGVHGLAEAWSGITAGVYGRSNSDDGFGVAGHNFADGVGVGAWSYGGNIIEAYDGDWPGGVLRFHVSNSGTVYANGGYNTYLATGSGDGSEYRTLYGMTSAEAWTEDFGRATLKDGKSTVTIDPVFAQTVNLMAGYHVYLTPICPDLVVLGVTDQQADKFMVQGATLDGKPSGCAFDYRIVAKQRGHEGQRLEQVDIPDPVEVERKEVPSPGAAEPEPESVP